MTEPHCRSRNKGLWRRK